MSVKKDLSFVADSETASSPRSLTCSPPPVKRAARTYGRKREDPDISFTYSEQNSTDSIYQTGPPGMSDEVPPSEPSREYKDDDGENSEDGDMDVLPPSYTKSWNFGWKDKLKEIDQKEDLSEYTSTSITDHHQSVHGTSPTTTTFTDGDTASAREGNIPFTSRFSRDASSGSFISPIPPSQSTESLGHSRRSPFQYSPRSRSRARKNIVVSDDEMSGDDKRDSRPSSPRTSSPPPLRTPRSQLTSSPPTSHHNNSASSSISKGKTKSVVYHSGIETPDNLGKVIRPHSSPGQRQKKQKIKPPTKKELRETARERTRIVAAQEVTVDKPAVPERSLATFFQTVKDRKVQSQVTDAKGTLVLHEPSSPINQFSSSQIQSPEHNEEDSDSNTQSNIGSALGSGKKKIEPGTGSLDKEQQLRKLKNELLRKQNELSMNEDDEDDLEVVPPTKLEQQRRSAEKKKMSNGQRMAFVNGRVKNKLLFDLRKMTKEELDTFHAAVLKHGTQDPAVLAALMRREAVNEGFKHTQRMEEKWARHGGMVKSQETSESVKDIQQSLIQKGLDVWTKPNREWGAGEEDLGEDEGDHDDNDDDTEWEESALRGSMSPTRGRKKGEKIDDEKTEFYGEDEEDQDAEEVTSNVNQSDGESNQILRIRTGAKSKHRPRGRVVDSDESDSGEYNGEYLTIPKPKDNHYLASSSDDRTEDENDKENNTRLMFDRSEDKENKAVTRHKLHSSHPIFAGVVDSDSSSSPSHISTHSVDGQVLSQSTASPNEKRKPFGVISDASPLSPQQHPSTLTQAFIAQLKYSSPPRVPAEESGDVDVFGPKTPAASLDFAPVFGNGDAGREKKSAPIFSQFSQDGPNLVPALLQRGFSDLFDLGTQKAEATTASAQGLQRQESLGLTQDMVLQPAFRVDEKLSRKADAIFEKEQDYVVETAAKNGIKEPELYVNEVGLLTQTKPSSSRLGTRSPSFILSPMQTRTQLNTPNGMGSFTQGLSSDLTQTRPPLRTITLSNPQISSPETSPKRRRLHKRGETPTPHGSPISTRSPVTSHRNNIVTSPQPRLRNLNDVLGKVLPKEKLERKDKGLKRETLRNDWVAEEAEESDEDKMAGFGFIKKWSRAGEAEDETEGALGEDLDAPLAELVDDQKMDVETEAVDLVMKKHQELLERDDEEAIKFHQGVIQGEMRRKRKNRFGIDESDDEDEEDERARRIRRKIRENAERGDIQELAADEKTAAFASVYQTGLVDNDIIETRPLDLDHDFRTSRESGDEDDADMESTQGRYEQEEDREGAVTDVEAGDEDGNDKNDFVTYKDIQSEVRRMKEQQPEGIDEPDYEDVSWIDKQDDGEMDLDRSLQIQVLTTHKTKAMAPTTSSVISRAVVEWDSSILGGAQKRKENEKDVARSRAWAKAEAKNMTGSTGRKVGAAAVTGRNKTKSGGGSLRSRGSLVSASTTSSVSSDGKKPLRSESSVLAGLAKRRFD